MGGWAKTQRLDAPMTHAVGGYLRGRWWGHGYHWWHGHQVNWSWSRIIRNSDREKTFEGFKNPYRFAGFTDARDCARTGGHVGCAGGAERFGQDWRAVLDGVVDWWSASFVGVARWSVDGSVVSQLSEDLRSGTLVGRRCDDALVHVAERSDRDSSCGETDRADGCTVHGLDVSSWFHSERSCEVGSCRDKGGQ